MERERGRESEREKEGKRQREKEGKLERDPTLRLTGGVWKDEGRNTGERQREEKTVAEKLEKCNLWRGI